MWDDVKRLHEFHGDVPVEVRILKLTEEVGEAAEAPIGVRGLNARKGCATPAKISWTNWPTSLSPLRWL